MNLKQVFVAATIATVSAVGLSGCAGTAGSIAKATFIPSNPSGSPVVLTASADPIPVFELPAGQTGSLELEFPGPNGTAEGLDSCTLTWDNVGTATAKPTTTGTNYVFRYDLPGAIGVGSNLARLECPVTTGKSTGSKYNATFAMKGIYNYVYWTTGTGIGRMNLSNPADVKRSFISGLSGVTAVAVYGDKIYFSDTQGIGRANLDGTNVEPSFIPLKEKVNVMAMGRAGSNDPWIAIDTGQQSYGQVGVFGSGGGVRKVTAAAMGGNELFTGYEYPGASGWFLHSTRGGITPIPSQPTGLAVADGVPYWTHGLNISRLVNGKIETVSNQPGWGTFAGLAYTGKQLLSVLVTSNAGFLTATEIGSNQVKALLTTPGANGGLAVGGGADPANPQPSASASPTPTQPPTPTQSPSPSPTPSPVFSVTPASHDFGTHAVGFPSGDTTFTIKNTGNADLTIPAGGVTMGGTDATDFDFVPGDCDAATLAPGQTCTVDVLFSPTAVGPRSAQLLVETNAAGSRHTVALSGTAVAPALSFSPDPAPDLDTTAGLPVSGTLTITNDSASDVVIGASGVQITGDSVFSIKTDGCSVQTLPSAGHCDIEYTFSPTGTDTPGMYFANIEVSHNGPGSPVDIPVAGNLLPGP